jgi:acetyltransferase-like isoleucine patch superfamily enzyme
MTTITRGGEALARLRDETLEAIEAMEPIRSLFSLAAGLLPEFRYRSVRTELLRWTGADVALGTALLGKVNLVGPPGAAKRLRIQPGCIIGSGVTFGLDANITLGTNVAISPGAALFTGSHPLGFGSRRMSSHVAAKPIDVADGAWIGMNVLVLSGVSLGRGCVVSAGSVVTSNVPENTLVAGNPATVMKRLPLGER